METTLKKCDSTTSPRFRVVLRQISSLPLLLAPASLYPLHDHANATREPSDEVNVKCVFSSNSVDSPLILSPWQGMKFGQELKQHSIDEWRKAYINYRYIKKLIGRAQLELEELDEAGGAVPAPEAVHVIVDGNGEGVEGGPTGFTSSPPTSPRLRKEEQQAKETVVPPEDGDGVGRRDMEEGEEPPSSEEDHRLAKQYSNGHESIPELVMFPGPMQSGSNGGQQTRATTGGLLRGLTMRKGSIPLVSDDAQKKDKKWRYSPDTSLPDLLEQLPPASRKFFAVLDREFDRVSDFYEARELDAVRRFENLKEQWEALEEHKREYQVSSRRCSFCSTRC